MHNFHSHADPPRTLADRLKQLNDNLQSLAVRLKDAIAGAISSAVGQAIRDAVRSLLGVHREQPGTKESFDFGIDRDRDQWAEDADESWSDDYEPAGPNPAESTNRKRWSDAFRAAIQTSLWWIRHQPCRRPLLTTTLVALAAGSAAFIAGPAFAACVSVVASVASLLLTADAARSGCGILAG